jgi:hypothetical protein
MASARDADDYDADAYDAYITSQVLLPKGDQMRLGTVRRRTKDENGNPVGRANNNPILDSRLHVVDFPDGESLEYAANIIAENIYSQVDDEGRQQMLLDEIVDHRTDEDAVAQNDGFIIHNGRSSQKRTTKGWQLCVQWKDGSTSWERLADIKESYPVQAAEYAVARDLVPQPAFVWWVPYTLKKRDRIIAAMNSRTLRRTHKFGIELPKTVEEALQINKRSNTTFWRDAIAKEMKNVSITFDILERGQEGPNWVPIWKMSLCVCHQAWHH